MFHVTTFVSFEMSNQKWNCKHLWSAWWWLPSL